MNRFECSECGRIVFSADDIDGAPCGKCSKTLGGSFVLIPFGFFDAEMPLDFDQVAAW